jgi:DNA-directed RNA polymerase subunit beta'
VNRVLTKKALSELIDSCYRADRNKATVLLADRLRTLGFDTARESGHLDLHGRHAHPAEQEGHPRRRQADVETSSEQYQEGLITDGERYNKIVDIWAATRPTRSRRT